MNNIEQNFVISNDKHSASDAPTLNRFKANAITRNQYNNSNIATYGYPYASMTETRGGASLSFDDDAQRRNGATLSTVTIRNAPN